MSNQKLIPKIPTQPRPTEAKPTRLQHFVMERWHRRQITAATYNPRAISPAAKRLLKEGLKRDGLVMPIVVNRTTGHIVAGHRRLEIIDSEMKTDDYLLDVAVIEKDIKQEKELNVFLNNENAQGYFDDEALASLMKDIDFSVNTGFELADIQIMFEQVESPLAQEALAQIQADVEKINKLSPPEVPKKAPLAPGEERKPVAPIINPFTGKETKKLGLGAASAEIAKGQYDHEHYIYIVFKSSEEREEFLGLVGEQNDQRYLNGSRLLETLKENSEDEVTPTEVAAS